MKIKIFKHSNSSKFRRKSLNKKGILMPETLKIILAVIGILILIYLAVSLYGIFTQKTEVEQAKASLEIITFNINEVAKGEKTGSSFLIESPKDWWITAWPNKDLKKPDKCKKENCICICPDNSLEKCNEQGICKDLSIQVALLGEDSMPTNLKIERVISLDTSLLEPGVVKIKVSKEDGGEFGGAGASGEW